MINSVKAMRQGFFKSNNNFMSSHKVHLISVLIIPVWKFCGMSSKIINLFQFAIVEEWKPIWIINNTNMWCNFNGSEWILWGNLGTILMLDPLPLVAKVFNLVVQEERQCTIGRSSMVSSESMAFAVNSSPSAVAASSQLPNTQPRENRPIYFHCGITGHTVDWCYKLHGYPLEYKPKSKSPYSA